MVLMYDRETQRVGIKILNQPVAHAYPLRKTKNSRQCSASSFLRFYEIEHDQTRSYPAEWSEKEGAIVIRLDQGRIATKQRRGK